MKTLEELELLSKKLKHNVDMRTAKSGVRVLVSMDDCGIESGARDILHAFVSEVNAQGLEDVSVYQTGCMGVCEKEPVIKVVGVHGSEVMYGNVTKDMVKEIVEKHIMGDEAIKKYTI